MTAGKTDLFCPLVYIATPFFVLFFGYSVSIIKGTSYFTSRYLVPSLAVFWLGTAILTLNAVKKLPSHVKRPVSVFIALVLAVSAVTNYRSQFLSEYDNSVNDMTDWFDKNLSADDGYIIYEDSYQIELCMRYYYPELKKYDFDNIDEIKGNIWYFEVKGYENELERSEDLGYNIVYIRPMSFDRYSFNLYRLDRKQTISGHTDVN